MAYKGQVLLDYAKTFIGTPYSTLDCSGFIRKVLRDKMKMTVSGTVRYQLANFKARKYKYGHLTFYSAKPRDVDPKKCKAGDLIYKINYDGAGSEHVMMSDGRGGVVESSKGAKGVRAKANYGWAYEKVTAIVRLFEDGAQTTANNPSDTDNPTNNSNQETPTNPSTGASGGSVVESQYDYSALLTGGLPLTNTDAYRDIMLSTLNAIENASSWELLGSSQHGWNLGYLVDLVNSGKFKFILPEHSKNLNANYETVTIPGRSSEVMSYVATSGVKREVSLLLFAGEGLYKGEDAVQELHKDVAFVESLLYPDYNSAIIKVPPVVLLYLGPNNVLKGVVTNVSVNAKKPYTVDGRAMYIELSFSVTQTSDNPADIRDVRSMSNKAY